MFPGFHLFLDLPFLNLEFHIAFCQEVMPNILLIVVFINHPYQRFILFSIYYKAFRAAQGYSQKKPQNNCRIEMVIVRQNLALVKMLF